MSASLENIKKIIGQIENGDGQKVSEKKSIEEIMNIFLKSTSYSHAASMEEQKCFDMKELKHWKDQVNQTFQIPYNREILCFRRYFRRTIIFMKRLIRKMCRSLIQPMAEEQNIFNANVTASINALYNNEVVTEAFIYETKNTLEQLERIIEKKFPEEFYNLYDEKDVYSQIDYFDFENHFRGSRQDIKKRQSIYISYFREKDLVLDLGCGRGEFLELLKENGIEGLGIDNYEEFTEYCREKELDVLCEDVIQYLDSIQDDSVGGIFAAQLIEHLSKEQLLLLCHFSYAKLEKGGCLIIETPNPMCLSIYTNSFYMDPSHQKPVHPKMMEYFLKKEGFCEVEILYTEQSKNGYRLPLFSSASIENLDEVNHGMNVLSDLLFGSEDYAIIAKK